MPSPITEENLQCITKKVYALYAKHGFDGISMAQISAQTKISKATLYRYFTSKEDIVKSMVDALVAHLDSMQFAPIEQIGDVLSGFGQIYGKSIFIAALAGSEFLANLKKKLPDSYAAFRTSLDAVKARSLTFFRQASAKGYCKDLPFSLLGAQLQNMLPTIINMDFLEQNQMTLVKALREYYRMFLYQILSEPYLSVADREGTYDFVAELAGALQNDFFVDSIRR